MDAKRQKTAACVRSVIAGNAAAPVYSPAVIAGDVVFVSGQVALDPSSGTKELVGGGDVGAQAAQCLANLKAVLARAGSSVGQTTMVTIYMTARPNTKINNRQQRACACA